MTGKYLRLVDGAIRGPYSQGQFKDYCNYFKGAEEVGLGPSAPLPGVITPGLCVVSDSGRVGWTLYEERVWGQQLVRVSFSDDPNYREGVSRDFLKYHPNWDLKNPNQQNYKWGYYKGVLYFLNTPEVFAYGVYKFHYEGVSPITRENHVIIPDSYVEEPEEFLKEVPSSDLGPDTFTLAKNKITGEYFICINGIVYYPMANGEYFYLEAKGEGFYSHLHHFFQKQDVTFDDPVLKNYNGQNIVDTISGDSASGLEKWLLTNLTEDMKARVPFFQARIFVSGIRTSAKDRSAVSLYQNSLKLEKSILTPMRPGKAFKYILPELYDKDIEKLVDQYRKDHPDLNYTLKRSFERDSFVHMYRHTQAPMQNPRTTQRRKSLGNSCMRHGFSHLPHHPCEAYGSGEFEALWSETPDGRIASRLVVWHPPEGHNLYGKPQMGPVYGVCEYSIDLLEEAIPEAVKFPDATWGGARMLYIPYNGGAIAPYLDLEQSLEINGDYLVVGGKTDFEACDYSGLLGTAHYCECEDCGDRIEDEDDVCHANDKSLCYHCYNENYFTCAETGESFHVDERVIVHQQQRIWSGRTILSEVSVCQEVADNYYTECTNEEFWHNDLVTELYNGDYISPRQVESGDYAECSVDNMWYPVTKMYPNAEGGYTAKVNYDPESHALNEQGEVYELA